MINVRDACIEWSKQTFEEGLLELDLSDQALLEHTLKCFKELSISDKYINGYACEKLPKTEEGHLGLKFTYSEVFHDLVDQNNFSPVTYLVTIIEKFIKSDVSVNKINGAVARGLRTLTSLLREPDFAFQIEKNLINQNLSVKTELNSKQDGGDHTDVLLEVNGNIYRIWLFQLSSRGLPHDIERVSGKRGELPDGVHVLCPLHTEVAMNYISTSKKIVKLKEKLQKYKEDLNTCSARAIKKQQYLRDKIEKSNTTIFNLNIVLQEEFIICNEELDVLEGWFLYSPNHIKRISDFITSNPSETPYISVVKTLTAPEKYLSQIQIFKK